MGKGDIQQWQTPQEYAAIKKITTQAVYKKMKSGRLFSKKINGKQFVSESSDAAPPPDSENNFCAEKMKLNAELQKEKLKNLRADTVLKSQKIIAQKEEMKREICEAVYQAYSESFEDFKSELIELKLNKNQLSSLTGSLKKCLSCFGEKLKEYIRKKEESPDEESADESN